MNKRETKCSDRFYIGRNESSHVKWDEKKQGGFMKKLFMLFAAAAILGAVFTAKSYALTTDNAYVVVRCTVSVAVEVQSDATAAYFMGADGQDFWEITRALTVGTTEIATNAIQVRNTSVGAITKWKMKISAKEVQTGDAGSEPTGWENDTGDGAWTVGTSSGDAGPLIIKLYAAFKSAVADAGDFAGAKELPNILTESDKD